MTDKLLYRILSGKTDIQIHNRLYSIKTISSDYKLFVEEYYERLLEEYSQLDCLRLEGELFTWMFNNGLWSEAEEEKIIKYKFDLEELKIRLFQLGYKQREKQAIKNALKKARNELESLITRKHSFDFLTASGSALIAKNKCFIGLSIYRKDKPLFTPKSYFKSSFPYLDRIIIEYNRKGMSTDNIREIARSDTWRKYWCVKDADAIFGCRAIDLSDEQISLISWTRLYDNIFQHPDCPEDFIIEDDDALDGFLILDKRKRDGERGHRQAEQLITNPKIRDADEIFLPADNKEGAKKIHNLNDERTKAIIYSRDKLIEKKGVVAEESLPDVILKQKMAANTKMAQLIKGK